MTAPCGLPGCGCVAQEAAQLVVSRFDAALLEVDAEEAGKLARLEEWMHDKKVPPAAPEAAAALQQPLRQAQSMQCMVRWLWLLSCTAHLALALGLLMHCHLLTWLKSSCFTAILRHTSRKV